MGPRLRFPPRWSALLLMVGAMAACSDSGSSRGDTAGTPSPTTLVAEGVYRFEHAGYNTLFVVTADGVVAFDPLSIGAAARLADEIARLAPGLPLVAVVYSHHHDDHAPGAQVLRSRLGPGAPIIAHENAVAPIVARSDPNTPVPTITFSDQATLRFGEEIIELHYLGAGHSDSNVVAVLPRHGLAFAVDFVAADRVAFRDFPGTVFPDLFDTIERLNMLDFDTIVFGHGPSGDRDTIRRQVAYYRALRGAVADAVDAGLSEDETAAAVELSEFADFRQYDEWFELNVRGLYRWMANRG